jgi:beta-lactamase superfamily II metal-dependent hydrolase
MSVTIPKKGVIFWPVGTGDSTTISVDEDVVIQVDLHHLEKAEDKEDPHVAIVDELKDALPKKNDKPYLDVFVLTHPDEDHIKGFADLLEAVDIGELWFTPRIINEYKKDLCEDAIAFRDEAERRVKKTIKEDGNVKSGDRVRLIGYDDLLKEGEYKGFPEDLLTIPGNSISKINDVEYDDCEIFIHAPFKDDAAGDRNETSLAMRVLLKENGNEANVFLLGDLSYPTLKKIFDISEDENLKWNLFLAPHHCSKSVMYQKDDKGSEKLKQDILDDIKKDAGETGYIISSSEPVPESNQSGDNPPHAKAKRRYEEIVPNDFICTMEHPNEKNPEPIIFELTGSGLTYTDPSGKKKSYTDKIGAAVAAARGEHEPPTSRTGFGYHGIK